MGPEKGTRWCGVRLPDIHKSSTGWVSNFIEITSDATRIRLAAFQLEGESQVWWGWVKASRNLEAMTWEEFRKLFMGKYFPAHARHAKAWEFLELK